MLVLSRRPTESIVLPTLDIAITVVEVRGSRVRIGVSAPPHIEIHRNEVWSHIQNERAALAAVAASEFSFPSLPK